MKVKRDIKYFKIPYILFGVFDQETAYVDAKDEDTAKRKLVFHLSETIENKTFAVETAEVGNLFNCNNTS